MTGQALGGQVADGRRGAADRGQHRQAAGVVAEALTRRKGGNIRGGTDQRDTCGGRYQRSAGAARAHRRRGT